MRPASLPGYDQSVAQYELGNEEVTFITPHFCHVVISGHSVSTTRMPTGNHATGGGECEVGRRIWWGHCRRENIQENDCGNFATARQIKSVS